MKNNNLYKIAAIICAILLIYNFIILYSFTPKGYTFDIYSNFPSTLYISLIICFYLSSLLLLWDKKIIGILFFIIIQLEILLIPFLSGYYSMGRGDDMSYIGEYLQIAYTGFISLWDIYPATHIIGAITTILCNWNVNLTAFLLPIIFSFLFILGTIVFSKEIIKDKWIFSLVIISGFILYLGPYNFFNVPHAFYFSFIPIFLIILYKYIKTYSIEFGLLLSILILMIPFSHPFIVFFIALIIIFHMFPFSSNKYFNLGKLKFQSLILLLTGFFIWFVYNNKFMSSFQKNFNAFMSKITPSTLFETTEKLERIHLSIPELVKLILLYYGRYVIPTIVILISFIILIKNKEKSKGYFKGDYLYLVILYIFLFIVQTILLINPILTHQPDRLTNLNFIVFAQIPLFALSLSIIFNQKLITKNRLFSVVLLLSIIWSCSLLGCFDSPNVFRASTDLTYNEVQGVDTFFKIKDEGTLVGIPLSQINRFHDLFGQKDQNIDSVYYFPDHFGYTNKTENFSQINIKNEQPMYIILLTIDEFLYQEISSYKSVGRYNANDFIRFRAEKSMNKFYDSTNIEIYSYLN